MSTKSAKELKVTLEHIKHQEETVKCQYDFFKHMTTLNTGGFLIIVALMGGVFKNPNSKFRRLEEFIFRIADDLRRLGDRIEQEYMRTDEFAYMFEQSFRGVAENYQQEKIDAFRGILLNSAIRQDTIQDEKEFFLSLVNNLSVLHIRILKFLANPEEYIQEVGIEPNSMQGGFRDMFRILMPELDTSIIESAFGDLFGLGLINTNKTIFHATTSASGLRLVGDRVADLGRRFIDFCRVP